jgi:hypothetical protein
LARLAALAGLGIAERLTVTDGLRECQFRVESLTIGGC